MVWIDIVYDGNLRATSTHGPSGAELATDAPKDNEGRGESFSPTDLLATALGTCMITVMGIVARRHAWSIEGARARIEKHMVADPLRRVDRLVVALQMPAGLPLESRAVLEKAALTCPVKQSLHPEIRVETRFDWSA